ncbi:MAG: lysylphosphatidylglycerol synthase transmembrane domain-containing protein [Nitrososphaerales archaeon]
MRISKYLAALLLAILISGLFLASVDLTGIWEKVAKASIFWISVSAALQILSPLARAWRWKIMLRPVKMEVPLGSTFWANNVGFMVNFLIPIRVGSELVRAYLLGKKETVGFIKALSSVAVERVLDLVAISSLALFSAITLSFMGLPQLYQLSIATVSLYSIGVLVIVIVGTRNETWVLKKVEVVTSRIPFFSRRKKAVREGFASAITGARGLNHDAPTALGTLLLTWIIWLIEFTSVYALFLAFEVNIPIAVILLGTMLIQLLFILPSPPGYIGSLQGFWYLAFAGLAVVNVETILAMAILRHVISAIILLGLGYGGLISMRMAFGDITQMLTNIRNQSKSREQDGN